MKILMIYAHPNDKSYNASILETVKENLSPKHELRILDLYKGQFDPVLRFDATHRRRDLANDVAMKHYRDFSLGRSVNLYFSNLVEWDASYLKRIY